MRRSGVRSPSAPPDFNRRSVPDRLLPIPAAVPLAQSDRETALDPRAGHHRLVPALDIGEIGQIDLVALVSPCPAEDREVGNRDVAGRELDLGEPAIEHAIEPPGFLRVPLQAIAPILLVRDL